MDSTVKQYCARVGRHLRCLPQTRQELLRGLAENLAELPEEERRTLETLERSYASVMQTVVELQETVDPEEQYAVTRKANLLNNGIRILLMILSLILVGGFAVRRLHIPLNEKLAYYPMLQESGGYMVFTNLETANAVLEVLGNGKTIEAENNGAVFQSCSVKTVLHCLIRDGSIQIGDTIITDPRDLSADLLHSVYECNVLYGNIP